MNESKEPLKQPNPASLQLELKHLFWATAVIAAGIGFHPASLVVSALVIGGWSIILRGKGPVSFLRATGFLGCLGYVILFIFIIGMMLPAVSKVRGPHFATYCSNNMRQIQLAILNYESQNGCFPTDTIHVTPEGEEIRTSWRVSILPFMEADDIYQQYRIDEPWNGPNNSKLTAQLRSRHGGMFCCPSHDCGNKTPYKLVVGEGTAFEVGKKIGMSACMDGTANTISLVEDHRNPVDFLKPEDLTVDEAVALFNNSNRANSAHYTEDFWTRSYIGFNYTRLDAWSGRWPAIPAHDVDAGAFLINDGMFFDPEGSYLRLVEIKWGRVLSLLVYFALCFYPMLWGRPVMTPLEEAVEQEN